MPPTDSVQRYIERVRPLCAELYRRAHVITGNAEIAEFVLQNAIADAYTRRGEWQGKVALNDALVTAVHEEALSELHRALESGSYEQDEEAALARVLFPNNFISDGTVDATQEVLSERMSREKDDVQRMAMLRFGCGLSMKEIAFAMQMKATDVRDILRMCVIRMERALKRISPKSGAPDRQLTALAISVLRHVDGEEPDMSAAFERFHEDPDQKRGKGLKIGRVARVLLMALGALLCAMLFWLIAVLLEPSNELEPAASQAQSAAVRIDGEASSITPGDTPFIF